MEPGNIVGRLTLLECYRQLRGPDLWLCRCKCGRRATVSEDRLGGAHPQQVRQCRTCEKARPTLSEAIPEATAEQIIRDGLRGRVLEKISHRRVLAECGGCQRRYTELEKVACNVSPGVVLLCPKCRHKKD